MVLTSHIRWRKKTWRSDADETIGLPSGTKGEIDWVLEQWWQGEYGTGEWRGVPIDIFGDKFGSP